MSGNESLLEQLPPEKLLDTRNTQVITPAIKMIEEVETVERYLEHERANRDRTGILGHLTEQIDAIYEENGEIPPEEQEPEGEQAGDNVSIDDVEPVSPVSPPEELLAETDIPLATAAADSNPAEVLTQSLENAAVRREGRAQTQEMDVAMLRQGGIYEVRSASGSVYEIDVLQRTCTCPDDPPEGGCKHYRRVRTDIRAGLVPRPDGKLPDATQPTLIDEEVDAIRSAEAILLKQRLLDALLTRELERVQLDQEIHDLEFLVEVLLEIGGSGGGNLDDNRLSSPTASEMDTDSDTRGVAAQTAV